MRIEPTHIEQIGPGIDLSNLPDGLSLRMADPVEDFEYARNAVTLTFDLSLYERARLAFEAKEFGDEPHAPPPGPFGDEVAFDGVAISADGDAWYEIQDLRSLRSDRFTAYDLDLDAAVAAHGLAYGPEFRVRFCQVDNNPAPMDGISLHGIALTAALAPVFHLKMDDNAADPTVRDAAPGQRDQTFLDPTGNPNTDAHAIAGAVGGALEFDGVDDTIDLGQTLDPGLGPGQDWTIAFWWRFTEGVWPTGDKNVLKIEGIDKHVRVWYHYFDSQTSNGVTIQIRYGDTNYMEQRLYEKDGAIGPGWQHFAITLEGNRHKIFANSVLVKNVTNDLYQCGHAGGNTYLGWGGWVGGQYGEGAMDDFRAYDRALTEMEVSALYELRQ